MSEFMFSLSIAGAMFGIALVSVPAQANAPRTWVSGKGSDSNPCTLVSPCRTFAHALTQTSAGGEIDVLDPAGYGAVTITQSISIINDEIGVGEAGIQAAPGTNAITIDAGPNDVIHLRGLTLEGGGTGSVGIEFVAGGILEVLNCTVRHFAGAGIYFVSSTSSGFSISNTFVSANNNGISIFPGGSGVVNGVIKNVTASDNSGDGIRIYGASSTGKVSGTIVESVIFNNSGHGIYAGSSSSRAEPSVTVRDSVIGYNAYGIVASDYSTVRIAHSTITGNTTYGAYAAGTMNSYGDNNLDGNTADLFGSLTPLTTR
jgi:hypothetical protein